MLIRNISAIFLVLVTLFLVSGAIAVLYFVLIDFNLGLIGHHTSSGDCGTLPPGIANDVNKEAPCAYNRALLAYCALPDERRTYFNYLRALRHHAVCSDDNILQQIDTWKSISCA